MNRIVVTLEQPEYAALLQMAAAELRSPPNQLRQILRQEAERRGLWLPSETDAVSHSPQSNRQRSYKGEAEDL